MPWPRFEPGTSRSTNAIHYIATVGRRALALAGCLLGFCNEREIGSSLIRHADAPLGRWVVKQQRMVREYPFHIFITSLIIWRCMGFLSSERWFDRLA